MIAVQPPDRFPFTPGEAVFFLPNSSPQKQPIPFITATIVDTPWNPRLLFGSVRVQRDDKPRTQQLHCGSLAYRGYCAACQVPAIAATGALVCPRCGKPATCEPPPDVLVVRWYPLEKWYTPMVLRRAFEHPTWTRGQASDDVSTTVHDAYMAALTRLGLVERGTRSTDDFDGWRADYDAIKRMNFYAILHDDAAFLATYQALVRSQESAAPVPPRRPRSDQPRPLRVDWEDTFLRAQMDRAEKEETHGAPLVLPAGDDQPDPDHGTAIDAWLDRQFRKAA